MNSPVLTCGYEPFPARELKRTEQMGVTAVKGIRQREAVGPDTVWPATRSLPDRCLIGKHGT